MYLIKCEEKLIINPVIIEMSYLRNEKLEFEVRVRVDGLWIVVGKSKNMLTARRLKDALSKWMEGTTGLKINTLFEIKSIYLD